MNLTSRQSEIYGKLKEYIKNHHYYRPTSSHSRWLVWDDKTVNYEILRTLEMKGLIICGYYNPYQGGSKYYLPKTILPTQDENFVLEVEVSNNSIVVSLKKGDETVSNCSKEFESLRERDKAYYRFIDREHKKVFLNHLSNGFLFF